MQRGFSFFIIVCFSLLAGACAPQVAMQSVPVSTAPIGAQVLVDGNATCTSPCSVDLPRNKDHILTLLKDGYRQHDVIIKRQYQQDKTILNALQTGVNQGTFFNNPAMGVMAGVDSIDSQEKTGEAYILQPSAVSVQLVPNDAPANAKAQVKTTATGSTGAQESQSLDIGKMDKEKAAWGAAKVGASALPGPKKTWKNSNEKSHTSVSSDGTVTKTTTKTSTSASVSVNPAAAVDLLESLTTSPNDSTGTASNPTGNPTGETSDKQ
ncbi:MAG: PEGA domain-containing protein [Desulfovibrio sp.]|uniref:PEGA domain-containing protein n=1 Tax=Desulfovibrio sp. 7SRBS1 TaxID=3378064 RepID=UPI003B4103A0